MNKHSNKGLSIQISLSGLSFCILNERSNSIEYLKKKVFEKRVTPFETLEHLITALNTNTIFEQSFQNVLLIYQNELSTCVPKSLFNEANCADYLKFNAKILNTDFITYDEIPINNSINVFVPFVNINNYIFERFGAFEYKHASTILIESLVDLESNSNNIKMYVNVDSDHFEIIVVDKGDLMFYNSFNYLSKEDFIYFILFTVEQLKLDTETIPLILIGNISKDDELFEMVYKYIRFVDFIEPFHDYKFIDAQNPPNPYSNFVILNSFN